jgi:hypothetical protein
MRIRWVGHVTCPGERRSSCEILIRKTKGKRPL